MPPLPPQIYGTARLWVKNAMLPNLKNTGYIGRLKHFNKLIDPGLIDDGFFMLKDGVDLNRYKGLKGLWNRLGLMAKSPATSGTAPSTTPLRRGNSTFLAILASNSHTTRTMFPGDVLGTLIRT